MTAGSEVDKQGHEFIITLTQEKHETKTYQVVKWHDATS